MADARRGRRRIAAEARALARLYDVDLVEDPGDLDLYLALAPPHRRTRSSSSAAAPAGSPSRWRRPATTSPLVDLDPAMLERAVRAGATRWPREDAVGSTSSRPTCSTSDLPRPVRSRSPSSP